MNIDPSILSRKRTKIAYFLCMLIWPFGVFLAALRHRKQRWSMNIFWMFCLFLGLTFVIVSEMKDAARYADMLSEFHTDKTKFSEVISFIYKPGSNFVDVVQPIVTWFVSIFTANATALFAVFGLIFGFFYSRNLWYLLDRIDNRISLITFVFVLTYALINPIWNINGFRMYTAAQVFIYGILPYLVEGNKKKLWWSISSILFHFSFIFPVAILLTYALFKNRVNLYFIFFLVTSLINTINLEAVREFLNFLPDILNPQIETYTNPNYAKEMIEYQTRLNWYVPLSGEVLTYLAYLFIIIIFLKNRNEFEGNSRNLFCFTTWFYGWANLASLVPSGGRFISIGNMLVLFFIILYIQDNLHLKYVRALRLIAIPGLILFILVAIRLGLDYISLSTIIGNPILSLFYQDSKPLIVLVKSLL